MNEFKKVNSISSLGFDDLQVKTEHPSLEEQLRRYKELLENGKILNCKFSMYNRKKHFLYTYDNDVRIQIANNLDEKNTKAEFLPQYLHHYTEYRDDIGKDMSVIVSEIDEEHGVVYVVPAYLVGEKRARLVNSICDSIDKNEPVRVPAVIIGFTGIDPSTKEKNRSIVLLDIGNLGIIGSIRIQNWSTSHITSPRWFASIGDTIEVAATGISTWGKRTLFDCSRKLIMELDQVDPWKNIERRLPKHTDVELRCVDKQDRNFFSVIDGINDLEILCEYPDYDADIDIVVGQKYRGYISRVNEQKKRLCARITGKAD